MEILDVFVYITLNKRCEGACRTTRRKVLKSFGMNMMEGKLTMPNNTQKNQFSSRFLTTQCLSLSLWPNYLTLLDQHLRKVDPRGYRPGPR